MLTEVRGGTVTVDNHATLTTIDLPVLASVGNSLAIRDNGALTTLNLPSLALVPSGFRVSSTGVTVLSVPLLTGGNALDIDHNPGLTTIELPALRSGATFDIFGNASLTTLNFAALKAVTSSLNVYDNSSLRQCLVDALRLRLSPPPFTSYLLGNTGTPNTCP